MTNILGRVAIAAVLSLVHQPPALAAANITSSNDLPAPVAVLYGKLCAPDFWADGKQHLEGSTSTTFKDGTAVYLMVCGDAASTVPFSVIVLASSGEASEAKFHWRLRGKDVGEGAMGNVAFGAAADTVVSYSHARDTCNPRYTHRWTGAAFELIKLNRAGCRHDE